MAELLRKDDGDGEKETPVPDLMRALRASLDAARAKHARGDKDGPAIEEREHG